MNQSPSWIVNNHPVSWNPDVHCRVHKSPERVPTLNQINPAYIILSSFFHFNLISSTPVSESIQELSTLKIFRLQFLLLSLMRPTCPAPPSFVHSIIFGQEYKLYNSGMRLRSPRRPESHHGQAKRRWIASWYCWCPALPTASGPLSAPCGLSVRARVSFHSFPSRRIDACDLS
jgi:hypothetical protein